jgi:molecular chaperone DnaK
MEKPIAVGIDLGTSTSEISFFMDGKPRALLFDPSIKTSYIVPSIVAVDNRGMLLVGEKARDYVDIPGRGVREVKRKMGSGERVSLGGVEYRPEEISAFILKYLVEYAEKSLKEKITDVIITVPANWNDAKKTATKVAGELAGLNVIRLINEPTAAALAFGIKNIQAEEQLLVFDFGGGTLDITVFEMMGGVMDVICSDGDDKLGGKEFDEVVKNIIIKKFKGKHPGFPITEISEGILKGTAEKTKKMLSTEVLAKVFLPKFSVLKGETIDFECVVSREEFEHELAPFLDRARICLKETLKKSKVRPSAIGKIILVGGTTYVPCVRNLVREFFGKEPKFEINPDIAVSFGASIQCALAKNLISEEDGIILQDNASFGIGTNVLEEEVHTGLKKLEYSELMPLNQKIPFTVTKLYELVSINQKVLRCNIYQDRIGRITNLADAIQIGGEGRIENIPPSLNGQPHEVAFDLTYDVSGIINLCVRIPATGQIMEFKFDDSVLRMNDEEIKISKNLIANTPFNTKPGPPKPPMAPPVIPDAWKNNPESRRWKPMIEKGKILSENLVGSNKTKLVNLINYLCTALAQKDSEKIEEHGNCLTDLLFDLGND